jgi:hypothetical protein
MEWPGVGGQSRNLPRFDQASHVSAGGTGGDKHELDHLKFLAAIHSLITMTVVHTEENALLREKILEKRLPCGERVDSRGQFSKPNFTYAVCKIHIMTMFPGGVKPISQCGKDDSRNDRQRPTRAVLCPTSCIRSDLHGHADHAVTHRR